jgi:L-alanine-DL-glutamate epimerase-like enolase superfamily enzyme
VIITQVDAFPLRIPFAPGSASRAAGREDGTGVGSLLVRVATDAGIEGWGEAFGLAALPVTRRAVEDLVAPLCIGQDAARAAPLTDELQRRLHAFGRGGPVTHALSAVDIALWDIAGKAAGLPVHRLLGGAAGSLPCYASLDPYGDPAAVGAGVKAAVDAGFTAVKLHERDLPAVRAARAEAGPLRALMLDVNCPWTLPEAVERAALFRDLRLAWLEEPLWPPEDYAGLAELRARCGIPLAAGENAATPLEFDRLMAAGAVDFVQPSPAKMGGVTALAAVFPLAAARGVTVMPHTFYHGPGLLAAIHVTAALGTASSMIEWRLTDVESYPYGSAIRPVDGRLAVPQAPGLGIDPDPAVLREFAGG